MITVYKCDHQGAVVLSYSGDVIARGKNWVYLLAVFQVEHADLGVMTFVKGDHFHEWFYTDRWYNVFKVVSGKTGQLKGWYCNVTRPAEMTDQTVKSDDLALDVLITPFGDVHLLDEDEFATLNLSDSERQRARDTVTEIITAYRDKRPPFDTA